MFVNQYKQIVSYPNRRKISRFASHFLSSKTVYRDYIHNAESIFVHIPKSAGKSVATALYGSDKPGHYFAEDYLFYDKKAFDAYFKFAFVREPVDRFISAYNFLRSGGTAAGDKQFCEDILSKYTGPDEFVEKWLSRGNLELKEHFVPQYRFTHVDNQCALDFVGKYETLAEDFAEIQLHVPSLGELRMMNKGELKKVDLSVDTVSQLQKLYEKDYVEFGY